MELNQDKKGELFIFFEATLWGLFPVITVLSLNNISPLLSLAGSTFFATFFFALAAVVFLYDKRWGAGFFLATLLVGVSRVIAGVHYPSDILGGMIIGIATSDVVFLFLGQSRSEIRPKK